jgi:hypothetical protein
MAITDYIPNIFGSAAPTTYDSLQTLGLISPQQLEQQKKTANIQGLLGAGLALAQGMSKIGPRRSAAENIFGALAGGFGAAGGAYQQGLQNIIQQQQLQSAALTQAQAASRLKSVAEAKAKYPDLAPLFDIDPGKAMEQVILREDAKIYGLGTNTTQVPTQVPAEMPVQIPEQVERQGGLLAVPSFGVAPFETVAAPVVAPAAAPSPAPSGTQQPSVSLVDPANVAKAADYRQKAAFAYSRGNEKMGKFFTDEADRLDPKEQLFFRDDKLVSSKRGIIGDFSGGKILSDAQATELGLDPTRGKWTIKGGIPSLVAGTSTTRVLSPDEVAKYNLSSEFTYQISPEGNITSIPKVASVKTLSAAEAKAQGLNPNYVYQVDREGNIKKVEGENVATLSADEVRARGLNPNFVYQIDSAGNLKKVEGSGVTKMLSVQEAVQEGLDTRNNKRYQRKPDGTIDYIQGSEIQKTVQLSDKEAKDLGLDISRGQKYQQNTNGNIDVIQGTMKDLEKYTGMYANVSLEKYQTADVTKLTPEQRVAVGKEAESRTGTAAEKGAPKVYTGQLSKTTAGNVEQSVITTADAVTRLNNIQFSYRPEYQTIQYRGKQAWSTLKDKVSTLSDKEKTQLTNYSRYRQNALQNLNQTIKDITGAAMGVQEAERIIAQLPNAGTGIFDGDSPTEFEAKLNNAIQQTKYALARKQYSLRKGLNWENTPLDKIPSIVQARGKAIAQEYNLDPNKPADLNTINRQLAAEFGVSF